MKGTEYESGSAKDPVRRNQWYKMHNIHPPRVNPGGWSSHGQPVDALHGTFRAAIRRLDLASTGQTLDLRKRQRFEELDIKASGAAALAALCIFSHWSFQGL